MVVLLAEGFTDKDLEFILKKSIINGLLMKLKELGLPNLLFSF